MKYKLELIKKTGIITLTKVMHIVYNLINKKTFVVQKNEKRGKCKK